MNLKSAPATIALGSAALVLLVLAAWMGLIGPALTSIGEVDTARAEAQDRYGTLRVQLAQLRQQAEELPETGERAAELDRIFPPTADQPGFFAQVTAAADRAGIPAGDITTVSPDVPVLVGVDPADPAAPAGEVAPGAEAPEPADLLAETRETANDAQARNEDAAAADGAEDGTEDTGDGTDEDTGTTMAPVSPSTYAVQRVEIAVDGDYAQLVAVMRNLETMDRALLSMQAGVVLGEADRFTLTLSGTTFVAPPLGAAPVVAGT